MSAPPGPTPDSEPAALTQAVRAAARFDRGAISISAGLLAAIPVVTLLAGGIILNQRVAAVTMGAGAMLVGIAWRITGGRPPLALMATDAALMAVSTFVGSITGAYPWAHTLVLCLWALLAGLLVSLGGRGALLGTQAIIAVVVFGRFSQPAAQALGLAAYVLAGGLAQVVFLSLVRWPTPLRAQRDATAAAYSELARVAAGTAGSSTLAAAQAFDDAQAALASWSLFGDAALMTLRSLVAEGQRMRVQLTAILALLDRARALDTPPLPELSELAGSALAATATALAAAARTITGAPGAEAELARRVATVTEQTERAAELAGLTPGGTSELRVIDGAPAAARPADHLALSTQIIRRLASLAGQLRAVRTLAPAAGRGGGLRSRRPHRRANQPLARLQADLDLLRANVSLQSPAGRHALRLGIVVPLASVLARELPLHRGYWMVVAAATVLRPEFGATFTRGSERALGTSAGVALAGAIAVLLHPAGGVTTVLVGLLAWAGYALFAASFAAGFTFITTLTVFLLNAISPDTLSTASARLLDTLVGGALGLIVFAIWPTWSRRPARRALAALVSAQRAYLGMVLGVLIDGVRAPEDELRQRSRQARLARTSAQETVALSLSDPAGRRIDADWSQSLLASMRRLIQAAHVLRLDVQENNRRAALPGLAPLAQALDELLALVTDRVQDGITAAPAADPPDLRSALSRFARDCPRTPDLAALLSELDEIVDAAGGLATLVGIDPADPPGMHEQPAAPAAARPQPA